ncbi:MAG: class I SAM-dependent methyltransferase [Candidatus Omnitrophica bacterium]|nr:class I SAM-dependent methyltransferase [Candidatus Omnitrophota bacterium]
MSARFFLVSVLVRIDLLLNRFQEKISSAFGSLVLVLSKPKDLEKFVEQFYNRRDFSEALAGEAVRTRGLSPEESQFVTKYLKGKKECLVLMSGGGRESLALAKLGFEVTGIETSQDLVERAKEHVRALSLKNCHFEVGNVLDSLSPARKHDALFLSQSMYSEIPTRTRRIAFLRKMRSHLKDDGFFYLEFCGRDDFREKGWKFRLKKWLAILSGGNRELEEGDVCFMGHYWHIFSKPSELLSEIENSNFKVVEMDFSNCNAILTPQKP